MHIILDHSFLTYPDTTASCRSLSELMVEMAVRYDGDTFTVLTHIPAKRLESLPANVKSHLVKSGGWKLAGWKWWNRFRLRVTLKKLGGDLYLTTEAARLPACPCKVCLFEIGKGISKSQEPGNRINPTGNLFLKNLKHVDGVITFSNSGREFLQNLAPAIADKLYFLPTGPMGDIQPLKWTDKENIKVQYAAGKEYFVYTAELKDHDNLYLVLRAFSRFKKRQLSNLQLVLAGDTTASTGQLMEKLSSFKYRADVHVLKNPDKNILLQVIGASYAFVGQGLADELQVNTHRAIHSGVPVLKALEKSERDNPGYGIMYTQEATEQGLSEAMQLIYKDENQRTKLIQTARKHIESGEKYDVVEACRQVFKVILQTKSQ